MKKIFFLAAGIILASVFPSAAQSRASLTRLEPSAALMRAELPDADAASPSRASDYDGTYYMAVGDYYFSSSVGQTMIQVNVAVDGDSIIISDSTKEWLPMPVKAPFNAETGVISFEPYVLFDKDGEVDMFAPFHFDESQKDQPFILEPFQATYDPAASGFVFPPLSGFAWPAWRGANALEEALALNFATIAGWYGMIDVESLETNRDYALQATTAYVSPLGDEIEVKLSVGSDIAKLYCAAVDGLISAADGSNGRVVVNLQMEVTDRETFTMEMPDQSGLYSIMFAAVNAAGKLVATATTYQVVNIENDDDWQPVAKTQTIFNEGLIADLFGLESENLEVELQESKSTPGRFRFEAPYAAHSKAPQMNLVDKKCYVYINATDDLRVYVEPSALGIIVGEYGAPFVFSWPALTAGTPDFEKEKPNDFGRYMNGKITVPTVTKFNNEPYSAIFAPSTLRLTLSPSEAIDEIGVDRAAAPAWDLLGRRVASPARGFYIHGGRKVIR